MCFSFPFSSILTDLIYWNITRRVLVSACNLRDYQLLNNYFFRRNSPQWGRTSSFTRFLGHTQRRTTFGRTPLDEWSDGRIDLQLTKNNTHASRISMPPVGLEPTITAEERPQTYVLDRAATGTGKLLFIQCRSKKRLDRFNKLADLKWLIFYELIR
jgi:hypothetical protein